MQADRVGPTTVGEGPGEGSPGDDGERTGAAGDRDRAGVGDAPRYPLRQRQAPRLGRGVDGDGEGAAADVVAGVLDAEGDVAEGPHARSACR